MKNLLQEYINENLAKEKKKTFLARKMKIFCDEENNAANISEYVGQKNITMIFKLCFSNLLMKGI